MIPVLYKFVFDTPLSQALLYLVAAAVVAYAAWSGWTGAVGAVHSKTGEATPATRKQKAERAVKFGAIGAALAYFGLSLALPASAPLGGKGEGLPIHTYGIMLAGGFFAATSLASRLAEKEWGGPGPVRAEQGRIKREQILDMAFWVLVGGIGGSKLLFILVNWTEYSRSLGQILSSPAKILDCLSGGLVFYGGLIGAGAMAFIFARKRDIDFLRLADVCIPTVSIGQCLGRLGCFSAGCCWGDVTHGHLPWAVNFPGASTVKNLFGGPGWASSNAFQSQLEDNRWVVESTGEIFHQAVPGAVRISDWVMRHGHTLPVHPTQLYESAGQLLVFAFLMVMRRHRRFHGQIFAMWLMLYAILRSTVELFRGDLERGTLHGLLQTLGLTTFAQKVPLEAWYNISTSQFISICMFTLGAVLLYRRGREVFAPPDAAPVAA